MAKRCVHKYRLRDLARKKDTPPYLVYVCTKQECSHHIRVDLVEGKLASCNRCGEPFIMHMTKLKHGDRFVVRPHCDECTKTPERLKEKKERISQSIDELMNSVLFPSIS